MTKQPDQKHRLVLIPVDDIQPEDAAALKVVEQNGMTVLQASDGSAIPAELVVVDGAGKPVAIYTAGPVPQDPPERTVVPTVRSGDTEVKFYLYTRDNIDDYQDIIPG